MGNILMGDEGIGVKAIEQLQGRDLPVQVELFDGGTAFHTLVGELGSFDKLIIVDAVKGGKPSGTVYRSALGEVEGTRGTTLSLHDIGVVETLMLERLVHRIPEDIVFIGVEPERIELSTELSPALRRKLPELVQTVLEEIKN